MIFRPSQYHSIVLKRFWWIKNRQGIALYTIQVITTRTLLALIYSASFETVNDTRWTVTDFRHIEGFYHSQFSQQKLKRSNIVNISYGGCTAVTITLSGHLFSVCYVDDFPKPRRKLHTITTGTYNYYFPMHHVKSLKEPFESKHISFRPYKLALNNI